MTLEEWVINLLNDIKDAALKSENFDLHLESKMVKELAEEWNTCKYIEID